MYPAGVIPSPMARMCSSGIVITCTCARAWWTTWWGIALSFRSTGDLPVHVAGPPLLQQIDCPTDMCLLRIAHLIPLSVSTTALSRHEQESTSADRNPILASSRPWAKCPFVQSQATTIRLRSVITGMSFSHWWHVNTRCMAIGTDLGRRMHPWGTKPSSSRLTRVARSAGPGELERRSSRVDHLLELVGLENLRRRYPHRLTDI